MPQPIYVYGGAEGQPVMHLAVANGFPPQTYTRLLSSFTSKYRALCLPPRALWPGEHPPADKRDWRMVTDDLLTGLEAYQLQDIIAIGHSFGAVASILAVIRQPQRFKALILMDPTILLPEYLAWMKSAQESNLIEEVPLVQAARRRRTHFASVEDAYQRFRSRSLFADWPDEVLRHYTESNLQPSADGQGFTLVWSADWEAYFFSTMYTNIWEDIPQLEGLTPTLFIRGGSSDTFLAGAEEALKPLLPSAQFKVIEGHGHLFPMSASEQTAQIIQQWLFEQGF